MTTGALAVVLALFLSTTASQDPPPAPAEEGQTQEGVGRDDQENAESIERSATPNPSVSNTAEPQTREPDTEGDPEQSEEQPAADWWLIIPTIVIAIAAIVQALTTGFQFKILKDSAGAAMKAAKAAEKQAATAERAMIQANRARIFTDSWTAKISPRGPHRVLRVAFMVVNKGRVPATIEFIQENPDRNLKTNHTIERFDDSPPTLLPDAEPLVHRIERELPDIGDRRGTQWTTTIAGRIHYTDEFRRRDRRFHRIVSGGDGVARPAFRRPDAGHNDEYEYPAGARNPFDEATGR